HTLHVVADILRSRVTAPEEGHHLIDADQRIVESTAAIDHPVPVGHDVALELQRQPDQVVKEMGRTRWIATFTLQRVRGYTEYHGQPAHGRCQCVTRVRYGLFRCFRLGHWIR